MRILSIETSCDETSAAVVEKIDDCRVQVLSETTATSLQTHAATGGVIPENAARAQVEYIMPVILQTLEKASYNKNPLDVLKNDIDAIAITYGPGLIGSLLVGVETAKTLAFALNKPIIPVNHLLAHLYANFIEPKTKDQRLKTSLFPFIGLIVSGGHTDLLYFRSHIDYQWLGGTRDDAAGECFDKCARLLGFSYPGGPKISKLAEMGNPKNVKLPKLMIEKNYDFSFSGLKTAFSNIVKKEFEVSNKVNEQGYSWIHTNVDSLPKEKQQFLYDLCASLEQTIIEVLIRKTMAAAEEFKVSNILIGGGVSANQKLIEQFKLSASSFPLNANIFAPERKYSTDNGAMIGAWAALNNTPKPWNKITANPELYFA